MRRTRKKPKPKPAPELPDWPESAWDALRCPVCGRGLVRSATGWVCGYGLDHTRIIDDLIIVTRLDRALPIDRTQAGFRDTSPRTYTLRAAMKLAKALAGLLLIPPRRKR